MPRAFTTTSSSLRWPARGPSKPNPLPALKRFLQIALQYKPVNLGDRQKWRSLPSVEVHESAGALDAGQLAGFPGGDRWSDGRHHLRRRLRQPQAAEQFLERVRQEDLGLSVNISTSVQGARGLLPFRRTSRGTASATRSASRARPKTCPTDRVLMLSTMCGHGMISHSLAKKMIDFVKENRRTPEQAAARS